MTTIPTFIAIEQTPNPDTDFTDGGLDALLRDNPESPPFVLLTLKNAKKKKVSSKEVMGVVYTTDQGEIVGKQQAKEMRRKAAEFDAVVMDNSTKDSAIYTLKQTIARTQREKDAHISSLRSKLASMEKVESDMEKRVFARMDLKIEEALENQAVGLSDAINTLADEVDALKEQNRTIRGYLHTLDSTFYPGEDFDDID